MTFKKNFFISIFILSLFSWQNVFAESCDISSWPNSTLSEYIKKIETELSEIQNHPDVKNARCEGGVSDGLNKLSSLKDITQANLKTMPHMATDFAFGTKTSVIGNTESIYLRDVKIFEMLEKRVDTAFEQISSQCWVNQEIFNKILSINLEIAEMRAVFQKTALTQPIAEFSPYIRDENSHVARDITRAYNQSNVKACQPKSEAEEKVTTSLVNIFNFGGKKDKMLEGWRNAAALIYGRGDISGMNYEQKQRQLLEAELSRQWLSQGAKDVMLRNFDCYKARTQNSEDLEEAMKARMECLSFPVTGAKIKFQEYRNKIADSRTTDELEKNQDSLVRNEKRAVNIQAMYATLQPMITLAQDNNDTTLHNLTTLHASLIRINEKLELRIPPMQNNCMKWEPGVTGWCYE